MNNVSGCVIRFLQVIPKYRVPFRTLRNHNKTPALSVTTEDTGLTKRNDGDLVPSTININPSGKITRHAEHILPSTFMTKLDIPKVPSPTVPAPPPDELTPAIILVKNYDQLFDIFSNNTAESIQEEQLEATMKSIFNLQKNSRTKYNPEALKNHPGFIKICERLRKLAPTFTDNSYLVSSLKTLSICEVSCKSKIFLTILHLIKHKINTFTLQQIIFLEFILKKYSHPLISSLIGAFPIVFESQLTLQLDPTNIRLLCETFAYASRKNFSTSSFQFIAQCIIDCKSDLSLDQLKTLTWSILRNRNQELDGLYPFIEFVLKKLGDAVPNLTLKECEKLISLLSDRFVRNRVWYNEHVCNMLTQRAIAEKWPLTQSTTLARANSRFGHLNYEFLEYYSRVVADSSESIHQDFNVLSPFANANYKPENFDVLMQIAPKISSTLLARKELSPVRDALLFAVLGFYPSDLISQIFDQAALEASGTNMFWYQVDELQRSVRTECPSYKGSFPPQNQLDNARKQLLKQRKVDDDQLSRALQLVMGGPSYVASNLLTKMGHHIDHMVVLKTADKKAVSFNISNNPEEVRCVEDFPITEGQHIVLIKVMRPGCYFSNADVLRGTYALNLRTLEKTGFSIVALNLPMWEQLLEHEKLPYLLHLIHQNV